MLVLGNDNNSPLTENRTPENERQHFCWIKFDANIVNDRRHNKRKLCVSVEWNREVRLGCSRREEARSVRKLYSHLWLAKPFGVFTCDFPSDLIIYTVPTQHTCLQYINNTKNSSWHIVEFNTRGKATPLKLELYYPSDYWYMIYVMQWYLPPRSVHPIINFSFTLLVA